MVGLNNIQIYNPDINENIIGLAGAAEHKLTHTIS